MKGRKKSMIKSNISDAQEAVAGFEESNATSKQVTLNESNINGMTVAVAITNGLVENVLALDETINEQAHKFPALAHVIELRDSQDSIDFSKGNM